MLTIYVTSQDSGRTFTATCEGLSCRHNKKDPVPPLCRMLIDQGYDPATKVVVCRGEKPIFLPRSLKAWADCDYADDDNRGLQRRKYRPLPDRVANDNAGTDKRPERIAAA